MNPRLQQWIIGSAFVWSASILGSTIGAAGINLRKEEPPAKKLENDQN